MSSPETIAKPDSDELSLQRHLSNERFLVNSHLITFFLRHDRTRTTQPYRTWTTWSKILGLAKPAKKKCLRSSSNPKAGQTPNKDTGESLFSQTRTHVSISQSNKGTADLSNKDTGKSDKQGERCVSQTRTESSLSTIDIVESVKQGHMWVSQSRIRESQSNKETGESVKQGHLWVTHTKTQGSQSNKDRDESVKEGHEWVSHTRT